MKCLCSVLAAFALLSSSAMAADAIELAGPNGKVVGVFSVDGNGRLVYQLSREGVVVVQPSPLGVTIDGVDIGAGVALDEPTRRSVDEKYPWRGVKSEAIDRYNGIKIPVLQKEKSIKWILEARAYNDGFALRYVVPGEGKRKITGEATAWVLPGGTNVWCNINTHEYEGTFERLPLEKIPLVWAADDPMKRFAKGDPIHLAMPVTLELPDGSYAAIVEADVMGYSGMTLRPNGANMLAGEFEDDPQGWTMDGQISSPWRATMTGPDLNALVNCDLIHNLCPPPDKERFPKGLATEWIKPGRMLWQWWAYDDPGTHWSKQKWFVDQAVALGCQYYLVDEGWQHTRQEWFGPGEDAWPRMKELCDYAKTKGIGIWAWQGWTLDEKRQWPGIETPEKRQAFFKNAQEVGLVGIKIDFMDSESHDVLAFYQDCLLLGAKHHIMINFHGANKPAGETRTWPNEMTREGVMGLEYNKWADLPPSHYATLPFTRYLAGPGDFTPLTLQPKFLKGTTFALQLAGSVLYTSPLLCWADKPEVYLAYPEIVDYMHNVPTLWDETRVLPGSEIGRLAGFARRNGDTWYVAIINGDAGTGKEYPLEMAFLGEGNFNATLYEDDPGKPDGIVVGRKPSITSATTLPVKMRPGGGFVGVFERAK